MAFAYPHVPHTRRHGPRGYQTVEAYKPWLRDEFTFRCIYCLWRERWCADGAQAFSVDHLVPRTTHPAGLYDYENLVYACCQRNALKQHAAPVLDPCREAFGAHLEVQSDGAVHALTPLGAMQIALCRLNRPVLLEARRLMLDLLTLLTTSDTAEARALWQRLCSFPDDLPQLALLRPPSGNTRPATLAMSYYAQRQRDELPETYEPAKDSKGGSRARPAPTKGSARGGDWGAHRGAVPWRRLAWGAERMKASSPSRKRASPSAAGMTALAVQGSPALAELYRVAACTTGVIRRPQEATHTSAMDMRKPTRQP